MKRIIFILTVLAFLALPLISADIISPGFKSIEIKNVISNFNDFPEYYFLTICGEPMPEVSLIEDGKIGYCYKFSDLSVYAVKKTEFNLSQIEFLNALNYSDFDKGVNNSGLIKIISDIPHYKQIPIASSIESETNNYLVNLTFGQDSPLIKKETERNKIIYFYWSAPILALIIIGIILIRRKNANFA